MIHYFADWIVPIAGRPIADGWVAVDRGRIVAVGPRRAAGAVADARELGAVAVLPGLINAHTHLELAYLRQAVPPAPTFVEWVQQVMARRREWPDAADPVILTAAERALEETRAAGTIAVGDVSNTLSTVPLLARAGVRARVFYELLRFNAADPVALVDEARQRIDALAVTPTVLVSLAAHAPYSVAPLLFRAIRADLERHPFDRSSVHVAEGPEEIAFIRSGGGPWREILQRLGAWDDQWVPPGSTPVTYLAEAGFLDARVLAVHGVGCTDDDLRRLAVLGVTLVTCPRSNRWVGAGSPPIAAFYAAGVSVAFGTDSLASVEDLNVFAELAEARRLAPDVPAARLLAGATLAGAAALGFEGDYGSIEPGKDAALIAITLPAAVADIEEYLVSGIETSQIAWIDGTVNRHSSINPPSTTRHPQC